MGGLGGLAVGGAQRGWVGQVTVVLLTQAGTGPAALLSLPPRGFQALAESSGVLERTREELLAAGDQVASDELVVGVDAWVETVPKGRDSSDVAPLLRLNIRARSGAVAETRVRTWVREFQGASEALVRTAAEQTVKHLSSQLTDARDVLEEQEEGMRQSVATFVSTMAETMTEGDRRLLEAFRRHSSEREELRGNSRAALHAVMREYAHVEPNSGPLGRFATLGLSLVETPAVTHEERRLSDEALWEVSASVQESAELRGSPALDILIVQTMPSPEYHQRKAAFLDEELGLRSQLDWADAESFIDRYKTMVHSKSRALQLLIATQDTERRALWLARSAAIADLENAERQTRQRQQRRIREAKTRYDLLERLATRAGNVLINLESSPRTVVGVAPAVTTLRRDISRPLAGAAGGLLFLFLAVVAARLLGEIGY